MRLLTVVKVLGIREREREADTGCDHPEEVEGNQLHEDEEGPNERRQVRGHPEDAGVSMPDATLLLLLLNITS